MNVNQQKRIRIAVPTNDEINIFPKMLGMGKYLLIYEIEKREYFKLIEKRKNPFADTMQHLKTLDVYELIIARPWSRPVLPRRRLIEHDIYS